MNQISAQLYLPNRDEAAQSKSDPKKDQSRTCLSCTYNGALMHVHPTLTLLHANCATAESLVKTVTANEMPCCGSGSVGRPCSALTAYQQID